MIIRLAAAAWRRATRDMDEQEAWIRALSIIHDVQRTIGTELSHEFRSTHTYQAYTALCGEAYHAFEDGQVDDALVDLLADQAAKVIELHREWEDGC